MHLAACCCIQCPGEREQSPVRVGGLGGTSTLGDPAQYFTCGFFTVGTCPFTSCSRVFRTSAPRPISCPLPNHPLPERKPWRADMEQWSGLEASKTTSHKCEMCPGPLSCLRAGNWKKTCQHYIRRDPVPCERHRHSISALSPSPCSSPTSQQLSSSCVSRDAQQGWPSAHIHNSVPLAPG